MKQVSLAAAAVAMILTAGAAHAEGWLKDGAYVSAKGGWTKIDDSDFGVAGGNVETSHDNGYTGSVAVGTRMGMGRVEVEGLHQEADVDTHSLNGTALAGSEGKTKLNAGMVNGYWDMGDWVGLKPYVGIGAGVANVKFDGYRGGGVALMDDDDNVMAYQGMAGVAYDINPCWAVTGEYRYVGTTDAEVRTASGRSNDVSYNSHSALIGFRYNF